MFKKRGRELFFDLVVGIGWMIYATIFLHRVLSSGQVTDLGLLLFFTLLAVMFRYSDRSEYTGRANFGGIHQLRFTGSMAPRPVCLVAPQGASHAARSKVLEP